MCSNAQTGSGVVWGYQVMPAVQPGTRYGVLARGSSHHSVALVTWPATEPPILQARRGQGNSIVVTWPISAQNFNLESTSDPTAADSWTGVDVCPAISARSRPNSRQAGPYIG